MNTHLVTIQTAKKAKEKGFNEPTLYFCNINTKIILEKPDHSGIMAIYSIDGRMKSFNIDYSASKSIVDVMTHEHIHCWLLETHEVFVEINLASDCELNTIVPYIYQFMVYKNGTITCDREFYDSFYDAMEAGINHALDLI